MGRIILVTGGNRRTVENYTPQSLAYLESYPTSPFWLALVSPSTHRLCRIHCSLSRSQVAELTHPGTLLLKLFEDFTAKLMRSFCFEQKSVVLPVQKYKTPTKNPVWWRLRNFRATLLGDANSLHGIAATAGFFVLMTETSLNPSEQRSISYTMRQIDCCHVWIPSLLSAVHEKISRTLLNVHN
jgi:hypothetical protein